MIFNTTSGGAAKVGDWKFITAAAKPATVAKNTFVAITSTTVTSITVSDTQPATPASGDVWFHLSNPEHGLAQSDGSVPIRCWGAYQYNGTTEQWTLLVGHYSYCGQWADLPSLPATGTSLQDCTWEQINRICQAGRASEYFAIGNTKTITLSTTETLTLRIIDFAHDDLSDAGGGKAAITFDIVDCMNTAQAINSTNTNVGGWSGSAFYTTLINTIYGTLPEDLKAIIKTVNKKTSAGNQSATIVTTADKIFLLSEVEVHGALTYAKTGEGTQYALYTSGGSKVKKVNSAASLWWLRSPSGSYAGGFCNVTSSGAASGNDASNANGVAFGLCI